MQCPLCKKSFEPHQSTALPFCSERCRSIDLNRWLVEGYSLPDIPDPEDDEKPEDEPHVNGSSG
jgi:endogenous inhibitor of DNA gyrase (YacG/DUF329 family)